MTTEQQLPIIGSRSFNLDSFVQTKYERAEIWYDKDLESCKVITTDPKCSLLVPSTGGFSPADLDVACICLASLLKVFGHKELGREVLGCYSRFAISNSMQQRNIDRRKNK